MPDCCEPIMPDTVAVTIGGVSIPLVYHSCGEHAGWWVGTVDREVVCYRFHNCLPAPVEKTGQKFEPDSDG